MILVLIFGIVLLVAVLLSDLANRTVLSTAVLFLAAGFFFGGVLGWIHIGPGDPTVSRISELALIAVLFTDGMKVGIREFGSLWRLPGRALLLGLPLTLALTALMCRYIAGLGWLQSFLIGAVLSPTDPVFAAAIVGRQHIPARLRHLLNVESGINDGLALPIVLALLSLGGEHGTGSAVLALQLAGGVAIGVVVPLVAIFLERQAWLGVSHEYGPLFALAIGIIVWGAAATTGLNEFLAAFAAGITVASIHSGLRDEFERLGGLLTEILKLSALLLFGAMIAPAFLTQASWSDYVFAFAALLFARPIALLVALAGARLSWREKLVAAWFGPKGFASVVYAMMVLWSNVADANHMFHLIALVIAISIVAHSSSDVPIARWFPRKREVAAHDRPRLTKM